MGEQRGFLLEPQFLQIEKGEQGLHLARCADREPHYVAPIGLPLLRSTRYLFINDSTISPEKWPLYSKGSFKVLNNWR